MITTIKIRRDTAANWTTYNPVLADGELCLSTDSDPHNLKIGDGVTKWLALEYLIPTVGSSGSGGTDSSEIFEMDGSGDVQPMDGSGNAIDGPFELDTSSDIMPSVSFGSSTMNLFEEIVLGELAPNINYSGGSTSYTHPTGDGNLHVPATGTTNSGRVLTAGATAGSLSWKVNSTEPPLGNPNTDGYVLASTADGQRYWAAVSTSGGTGTSGGTVVYSTDSSEIFAADANGDLMPTTGSGAAGVTGPFEQDANGDVMPATTFGTATYNVFGSDTELDIMPLTVSGTSAGTVSTGVSLDGGTP